MSVSVCPESVLRQNGGVDPDAVWDGEWGRLSDGCIRRRPRAPREEGDFGGSLAPSVSMAYFSHRNVFDWCVKN